MVAHGAASFARPDAATLHVTNTPNTVINWQGFSIGAGETTRFIQQSAASRVLNRVTGGDTSRLMGRLLSNGRVFLINPAGIVMGPSSVIDTAGFLASTLDISDHDFVAGRFAFRGGPDTGGIESEGYIRTGPDGEIILIAPEIENSGIIETEGGRLVLAAGRSVTLTSLDEEGITFEVQAPEDAVVNLGELLAHHGSAEVFAGVIENKGSISADGVTVDDQGRVVLTASHRARLHAGSTVSAAGGEVDVSVAGPTAGDPQAGFLALEGDVRADGQSGGQVDVSADRILAAGTVSADGKAAGGRVSVEAASRILATDDSRFSASGQWGGGGNVSLHAGDSLYTSGTAAATGQAGGRVTLTGGEVKLAAATVDAGGVQGGGDVRVGGGRAGGEGLPAADATWVNSATTLNADAGSRGDGGTIVVWGEGYSHFAGRASARGGSGGGDGGLVEISAREVFDATGSVDVRAPAGRNGTLVLDPKNFIIEPGAGSGASSGVGILSLVDPNPGAGDNFGGSISTLDDFSSSLLWVMNPNDDLAGTDSGAVYAFNTVSGALVGSVVGANAGDRVGSNGLTTVSGSTKRVLEVPDFNNGQGLVTTLDPASPPSAVLGTGNSLVGTGDPVVSGFGSGILYLGNQNVTVNGNANAGFLTFYDVENPATGLVSAANSLVGANAGDRVGELFPQSVSGSTGGRRFVELRSFNGGQGAVTAVDPFNFVPGTVGTGNALVGTGDPSFNTFLNGGNVLLWNGNVGVGGDTGYVTVYNVDTPTNGTLGAANALTGVGNGGGFVSVDTGTLSTFSSGLAIVRNQGFDPTSGSQANTGFLTVYDINNPFTGTVDGTTALVGANGGDRLGSDTLRSVSGSIGNNHFLNIPSFNANQGAVTAVDPFNFTPGIFDPASALVGTGSPSFNTFLNGGNVLLWNGNVGVGGDTGYVTVYNVDTPTNGTLGAANALTGVGNGGGFVSVDTGTLSTFSSGLAIVRNQGFDPTSGSQANTGFLTVYDINNPFTGTVDGTTALVGANGGDRLGSDTLRSVSGSIGNNHFLNIPSFNANQGAVTAVDPFNFTPGIFDPANALVGTGSPSFNTFLSGGNVLLWNSSVGVEGETGYVTVYNVDTPANGILGSANALIGVASGGGFVSVDTGTLGTSSSGLAVVRNQFFEPSGSTSLTDVGFISVFDMNAPLTGVVGATNSLIGGASGDRVGSNSFESVSGGTNWLLKVPNFAGGQGAVTAADPFSFGGFTGTLTAADAFTGVGFVSSQNFIGGGDVLLFNGNATVAGNANAGFVTVYNVDAPLTNQSVSDTNSLVGGSAGDRLGGLFPSNVNGTQWLFRTLDYDNGAATNAGAAVLYDTSAPVTGVLGPANAVVGSFTGDNVGNSFEFLTGGVLLRSPFVDQDFSAGAVQDVGAVTFLPYAGPAVVGAVGPGNSLVGANAFDQVGDRSTTFVSGSAKRLLQIPGFNGGQGAVTTIDPAAFQPGTVSTANSLVGTAGSSFSSVGGGIMQISNTLFDLGANADVGFITYYDVDSPFTGTVGPTTALVGGNAGDQVGGFPSFVSGSSKRLLQVPNFNGGQGAVKAVDPFSFQPGTLSAANSFTGVGDSIFFSNLGGGDILLHGPNADVGGVDRGFVAKVNVDTLGAGTVSASNSLVGANDLDRVGSNFSSFVSGSTRRVLAIPGFNGGLGAVTTIDTASFTPGVVSSSTALVGTGNPSIFNAGAGTVVLNDPNADVGGLTDNGYATVYDVDAPVTGAVSGANSLVGGFDGDRLGSGGINFLATGNALVRSPLADGSGGLADAGRLDILDLAGISGGGLDPTTLTFASSPDATVTVGAAQLAFLLAAGTNLALQANNDITMLLDALINGTNAGGTGGSLSLEAGRAITVNGDIILDGDLALLADLALVDGSGVQTAFRDAGSGDLTINDAFISGRDIALSGANVTIDPTTVSADRDLFVSATGDFRLLDDSALLAPNGNLGVFALGDLVIEDSEVVGFNTVVMGGNVTLRGATGPSSNPASDLALVEAGQTAFVAAAGSELGSVVDIVTDPALTPDEALALLESLPVNDGILTLAPGTTFNADALIIAGSEALVGFGECVGCNLLISDPLLNDVSEGGVLAGRAVLVPFTGTAGEAAEDILEASDEILALLASVEEIGDVGEEDGEGEEDEEGEDLADAGEEEGQDEQELQECR